MKRYFGIIFALIAVVVAIVFTMRKFTEKTTEAAREQNLLRLRGDYLDRVAWIRVNPDEKAYRDEVTTFLRWYFKEVNDHLNRFNGNRDFTEYLQELEERSKRGKGDEKLEELKGKYEYTRKAFDLLKGGSYNPHWTGTDKGVRLDILSASTQKVGVEERIHMPLVIWGIPRFESVDEKGIKRVQASANVKFNWRFLDEKEKLVAEMPGEGMDNRIDWPDRYIKHFPQGIVLGEWNIDRLPETVKTAEITFNISTRAQSGGNIEAAYSWKLAVPAEWKMAPGESWKGAQDSVRPEEEIGGKPEPKKGRK